MSTRATGPISGVAPGYEFKMRDPSGHPTSGRAQPVQSQQSTLRSARSLDETPKSPKAESGCLGCIGSFFVSCWDVIASFFGWIGSCFVSSGVDPAVAERKMAARIALIEEVEVFAGKWAWDKREGEDDTGAWLRDVGALSLAAREVLLECIKSNYAWMRELSPEEAHRRANEMLVDVSDGRIQQHYTIIKRKNDRPKTPYDCLSWWVEKESINVAFELAGPFLAKWKNASNAGALAEWQKEASVLLKYECILSDVNWAYEEENPGVPKCFSSRSGWSERVQEIRRAVLQNARSPLLLENLSSWFENEQDAREESAKAAAERKV